MYFLTAVQTSESIQKVNVLSLRYVVLLSRSTQQLAEGTRSARGAIAHAKFLSWYNPRPLLLNATLYHGHPSGRMIKGINFDVWKHKNRLRTGKWIRHNPFVSMLNQVPRTMGFGAHSPLDFELKVSISTGRTAPPLKMFDLPPCYLSRGSKEGFGRKFCYCMMPKSQPRLTAKPLNSFSATPSWFFA